MPVTCEISDGIALVVIDNPPVNVISLAVREGLVAALDQAESAGVARIIVTGAGKAFVAGADAKEFSAPPMAPNLPDILARMEHLPCVAAINGVALGGGLEIALACRARIAAPGATLGLPEVTLGVVPGAGGTQRMPRLVGLATALSLISEGRAIGSPEALKLGLVDEIASDVVYAARALPPERLDREPTSALPAPPLDDVSLEAARQQVGRRLPGQVAPLKAIELVAAAARLPFAEGLALERSVFLALRTSDQAAALRHVFFAERGAMSQSRTIPAKPAEVKEAVVVGGGTMGAAIAYAAAATGVRVTLVETDDEAAARARSNVEKLYAEAVARGKSTVEQAEVERNRLLNFVVGYDGGLPTAQIAIEAAFEDLDVKRMVFAALAAKLPADCVLATNTSYLDINRIAEGVVEPSRVLGLHFFSPAHVMKLVEVIRAAATSEQALATASRFAERLGKIPVRAGVCDGFIGNRILTRYRQICDIMLIEGALPWQVDSAMRQFGMAMGPYEVQDLSGLDIAYANRQRQGLKAKPGFRYIPIADRLVEDEKRLGRKTHAGWYDYANRNASPSARVEEIVVDTSRAAGIDRRVFDSEEIAERAVTAMIVEGMAILADGIAEKPSDIDLVMIHGYGFPRWRGGLMYYADTVGPVEILARAMRYAAEDGSSWSLP